MPRLLLSDVVPLSPRDVKAIVVESLAQGSHAALLTREKGIPTLTGLPGLLSQIRSGDEALVDAFARWAKLLVSWSKSRRVLGDRYRLAIARDGLRHSPLQRRNRHR